MGDRKQPTPWTGQPRPEPPPAPPAKCTCDRGFCARHPGPSPQSGETEQQLVQELTELSLNCLVLHHMFGYIRVEHLPEREAMLRTLLFFSRERARLLADNAELLANLPVGHSLLDGRDA